MFIWTISDLVAAGFFALLLLILGVAALVELAKRGARRIRNTFRNLWSRFHG